MLRSVVSFSSMTMISRVFGLLRDMVISRVFGVSAATDAFWVAFRIPNFMRRLFAEGSFTTAFVPVFTEIKETRSHADLNLRRIAERIEEQIDCTQCANCCKVANVQLSERDVDRMARHLRRLPGR